MHILCNCKEFPIHILAMNLKSKRNTEDNKNIFTRVEVSTYVDDSIRQTGVITNSRGIGKVYLTICIKHSMQAHCKFIRVRVSKILSLT